MDKVVGLFAEAMRLRLKGDVAQARQMFQQYEERATSLGMFPPDFLLVRHLLFEADDLSSLEEMWESSVEVLEKSLEMCESDDQAMGSRLGILISLTQVHIYLKQPSEASLYLEQARELLERFEQGELTVHFKGWEAVIFYAKRQQIEGLRHQIASLTDGSSDQRSVTP